MPRSHLVLLLSLAANVVLAMAYGLRDRAEPSASTSRPASSAAAFTVGEAVRPLSPGETWVQLNAPSEDDGAWVERLRAAGLPPYALRALVRERLYQHHQTQWQAIADQAAREPYWQSRPDFGLPFAIRRQATALLNQEDQERWALLGPDARSAPPGNLETLLDNLPEAKRVRLASLLQDYDDMRTALRTETAGVVLPVDRAVFAELEQEQTADLTALLSPDEQADYRRRASPSARTVQTALTYFSANEAEYLTLLALREQLDLTYGTNNSTLTRAQRQERDVAWRELQDAFAATLPPARAREFEIATDPTYPATERFVIANDLAPATTAALVELARTSTRQLTALQRDPNLSSTQRQQQLSTLAGQATTQLGQLLSGAALTVYRANFGPWLTDLTRAAAVNVSEGATPPSIPPP